jgi:hypothetical protein
MSAIYADVCDNAGSDAMRAIRISWRIVVVVAVVVVVVVVNDVAQGKGSRSSKTTKSETLWARLRL